MCKGISIVEPSDVAYESSLCGKTFLLSRLYQIVLKIVGYEKACEFILKRNLIVVKNVISPSHR